MAASPEQQFLDLTKQGGPLDGDKIQAIYDQLQPVTPEFLLGEWRGGTLNTGHSANQTLEGIKWAGKTFHSVDDAHPIVVYDDAGQRQTEESWGYARIREVKYRGLVSAAMIYDNHPVIDIFRYVSENVVAGAMDSKTFEKEGAFFYLTRL